MLTTKDNPYNPREDYESWLQFDRDNGYNTNEYLARIVQNFKKIGEEVKDEDIDKAIDEILEYDFIGIYAKV